jgi:hypothetical protein
MSLLNELETLLARCRGAFRQERSFLRARALLLASLVCLGRHTVTGLLCALGRQFQDWSNDYRVFSEGRCDREQLFNTVVQGMLDLLPPGEPFVAALDDTLLPKTGRRTPMTQYYRDPLGPRFQVNLIRAQRVLQVSGAVVPRDGQGPARMIPVDFLQAPSPAKPRKNAPPEAWADYRRLRRSQSLSRRGAERLQVLRQRLDVAGGQRTLWSVVDGRYTNGPMIKNLPHRTCLIGRIRGDAKLYEIPAGSASGPGRRRSYGPRVPTPEAIRQSDDFPWQTVNAFAAGKRHDFRIKVVRPLRWRSAGEERDLMLLVIAPLAYRPRKGARLLYRDPAYLICTDPGASPQQVLQAYVWRSDIEVNFRDEKQLLGVGQAQVRAPASVQAAPAFMTAAYALLLLAAERAFRQTEERLFLPAPKWRVRAPKLRPSTADLIQYVRCELWGQALGLSHFSGFSDPPQPQQKPPKSDPSLLSAVLYAAQ